MSIWYLLSDNAGKGTDVNGIRHSINEESLEMTCIVPSRWFLDSLEFEMKGGRGITLLNDYPPVQYESYLSRYIIVICSIHTYIHTQLLYECSEGRQR